LTLTAFALQVEHRVTPVGIDEPHPLFTWKLDADGPGHRQSGYRLLVEEETSGREVWRTGWVDADNPAVGVQCDGELRPATRYRWSLEVRDQDGRDAPVVSSWFETGLMSPGAWSARWLRRDPRSAPPVDPPSDDDAPEASPWVSPPCRFRREFEVAAGTVRARVYATAHGVYRMYLNGVRVGDDELSPGWTDYRTRLQYQTYDVTDLLMAGRNALGVVVADGWWSGYIGFDPRRRAQHYGSFPELLLQVHLQDADGHEQVVATDDTWTELPGELVWADALIGEMHDDRRATPGWTRPGFDDSTWSRALTSEPDPTVLVGQLDEPVRVTEDVPARSVTTSPSGRSILDFGQNLVGHLRVRVHDLPDGTHLVLRHGETLDEGELYTANLRGAEATDEVVVHAASGTEGFEPLFTSHGFRYVEVSGYPGDVPTDAFTARVVHSDTPMVGDLHCSDEMVEQLISNIRWGQRGNFVSIPTDCPQRDERLGWTADAQIFLPTACYNADVAAFMSRWMLDVVDAQDQDGAFPDVAPLVVLDREGAPAWGDAGVIVPHHLWRIYGDLRILERSYPAMRAWVDHIHRHNPDLVWRHAAGNGYGDWLQVEAETPREVVATAYFARSASLVAEAAEALGLTEDAADYVTLASDVRSAFAKEFVDDEGVVATGSQTGQLMALAWHLVPEDLRPAVFGHLCADLESRGVRLTTGFVGVPLLCPVLSAGGRDDLAFGLLHQEEFPSWGYSIRRGATTIWERWDGWTEERGFQAVQMNSFNHYSLGSVGEWLWRSVAGIDQAPGSVAYRELVLEPRLGDRLDWVSAAFDSPRGRIEVDWRREEGGMAAKLVVPPGRPAELRLPVREGSAVSLDDQPVPGHPAAELLSTSGGRVRLRLQPGSWSLRSSA
jgi:alpha-L-rhamnosidase